MSIDQILVLTCQCNSTSNHGDSASNLSASAIDSFRGFVEASVVTKDGSGFMSIHCLTVTNFDSMMVCRT